MLILFAFFINCNFEVLFAQEQRRAPNIRGKVWFNASSYGAHPSLKAMKGKVVLVFFWTLNDSTCEYVASYLNNWYAEYKEKGLEIIGVHTPEWQFNNSQSELYKKVDELGILFPVVVDESSSIRDAYGRLPWPAFCLVDRDGYIRVQYEGVSSWRDMKKFVQTLLEESGRDVRLRRETVLQ